MTFLSIMFIKVLFGIVFEQIRQSLSHIISIKKLIIYILKIYLNYNLNIVIQSG